MSSIYRRSFRYVDLPRHNKFWTIEVVGATAFVTYGKVGSDGATQVKAFASPAAALAFAAAMIKEKMRKGYGENTASANPGAPAHMIAAAGGTPTPTPARGSRAPAVAGPPPPVAPPPPPGRSIDI